MLRRSRLCSDFSLNNLAESFSTMMMIALPPMPATVSKPIPRLFSPIFFFCCSDLFMRTLFKIQICDECFFFSIWPPVAVNVNYFLVHAIIDGGAIIIIETLAITKLSSSLNSLAPIIQRVDKKSHCKFLLL